MDSDDFEWTPPTEAELKVIQAKRERADKISKLMGDYLLKGYRMLGTTCKICDVSSTHWRVLDLVPVSSDCWVLQRPASASRLVNFA